MKTRVKTNIYPQPLSLSPYFLFNLSLILMIPFLYLYIPSDMYLSFILCLLFLPLVFFSRIQISHSTSFPSFLSNAFLSPFENFHDTVLHEQNSDLSIGSRQMSTVFCIWENSFILLTVVPLVSHSLLFIP